MPKLYYTPTSCGAASFIAAYAAKLNLQVELADIKTKKTHSGANFLAINPKGNVPTLVLDDGTVLNEGSAVLQWIADQAPNTIAPLNGTTQRYVLQSALNYIASEVHPAIGGLFAPNSEEVKNSIRARGQQKLTYLENHLIADRHFLVGDSFTIADSYLYIVLSWSGYVGVDLSPFPRVKAYFERIGNLAVVKEAHARIAENPSTVL